MAECTFCGKIFPKATGKMYVKRDGTVYLFCTSKCEKNMLVLKRKPRRVRWTEEYHKVKRIERGVGKVKKEVSIVEKKTLTKKVDSKKIKKKAKRIAKRKKAKGKK